MVERSHPDTLPSRAHLAALVFFQMLPATMLAPAVRPLFKAHHGGQQGAMHAFMALNMIGAIVAAPLVARRMGRLRGRHYALFALVDALLLCLLALPLPTPVVLLARTLEGAAHVGLATALLGLAAARRGQGDRRVMPVVGSALMFAVALGSAIGGQLLRISLLSPFIVAAALLGLVSIAVSRLRSPAAEVARPAPALALSAALRALWVPVSAAFVARFTVGCIIVTFALFAHHGHNLSDASVGLHFTLMTFPFALGMYPAGRIAERTSRAAVLLFGVVVYAVALASVGYCPTRALPLCMVAAGLGSAAIFASTLCYGASLAPEVPRARAMALINAAGCAGMLLGPAAAGIVTALARDPLDPLAGYRAAFLLAALSLVSWLGLSLRWLARHASTELSVGAVR